MKVESICCAGLDGHKRLVVACVLKGALDEEGISKVKSFGTTTPDLMEMIEWLKSCGATQAAMGATGNYWMPIYNLLDATSSWWWPMPPTWKGVPGRKSDVQDAEWIATVAAPWASSFQLHSFPRAKGLAGVNSPSQLAGRQARSGRQ
jgi:transposase